LIYWCLNRSLRISTTHLTLRHLNIYCSIFNNSRINEKPTFFNGLHWVIGVGLHTKCKLSDYIVIIYHSVITFTAPKEYLKCFHITNRGQRSKDALLLSCLVTLLLFSIFLKKWQKKGCIFLQYLLSYKA